MTNNSITNQYINTYEFNLPIGITDDEGNKHDRGIMRATTGMDEIFWQQNFRTQNNPADGLFILLSRTVLSLGEMPAVNIETMENLLLNDFKYLVNFYNQINPANAQISLLGKQWATL